MSDRDIKTVKQQNFRSKIKIVDQHDAKNTLYINSNVQFESALKYIALKFLSQPPQQLLPFVPRSIFFEAVVPKYFFVKQQCAPKGKKFLLNITTHIPMRVSLTVNEEKPKFYSLQESKGIIVNEPSWRELKIGMEVQKIGMLTSVKLYLDLITVERESPKKKIVTNFHPKIDRELDEYLKNARGRTAEIIRSRSLARIKEIQTRRGTAQSFKVSRRSVEMIKSKSELLKFQRQKQFYIRHVEKMSPEHTRRLKRNQVVYRDEKQRLMGNLSRMIVMLKLGLLIRDENIKIHREKLRKVKIAMLCQDFIRIIKNKLKIRMTQKARHRMNVLNMLKFVPALIQATAIKNAKRAILESLTVYMQFRGLQQLGQLSEQYLQSLIKIQRALKGKAKSYRERIQILIEKICEMKGINILKHCKLKVLEKYLKECLQKGQTRFYLNRSILQKMLRENAI